MSQVSQLLLPNIPGLALSPNLQCNDNTVAHCSLKLLGSSAPVVPATREAEEGGSLEPRSLRLL
ncbi:protein PPP5D1-like, partial [Lemur catta]|uniref:protein PPP5D1-like n=1 Tax=Lemur catta TaxID=9447 RepID=UPI001E26E447